MKTVSQKLSSLEKWFKNCNWLLALLLIVFVPFIFIVPLIIIVFIANINQITFRSVMNISRHDYVYYYIYSITIFINGVLSYMIYKVTKISNEISRESLKLQLNLSKEQLNKERENELLAQAKFISSWIEDEGETETLCVLNNSSDAPV